MTTHSISEGIKAMGVADGIEVCPFPASTKQAAGLINGIQTDVSSLYFADKIMITISQGGRLSQWASTQTVK